MCVELGVDVCECVCVSGCVVSVCVCLRVYLGVCARVWHLYVMCAHVGMVHAYNEMCKPFF